MLAVPPVAVPADEWSRSRWRRAHDRTWLKEEAVVGATDSQGRGAQVGRARVQLDGAARRRREAGEEATRGAKQPHTRDAASSHRGGVATKEGGRPVPRSVRADVRISTWLSAALARSGPHARRVYRVRALRCAGQGLIIDPNGGFRANWDIAMLLLVVYVAITAPYQIAFSEVVRSRRPPLPCRCPFLFPPAPPRHLNQHAVIKQTGSNGSACHVSLRH